MAAIAVGAILCADEFFVARKACRYFGNELKPGTPFTAEGAKELLHLGVSTVWIPLVAVLTAQVAQGVTAQFVQDVEKLDLDGFGSVALGVMFIFMSLMCKYGVECNEKNVENDSDKQSISDEE